MVRATVSPESASPPPAEASAADLAYQDQILQRVSRTFALTIPELPGRLRTVVSNGYLLCRIADTIEDAAHLTPADKGELFERLTAIVERAEPASGLGECLSQRLAEDATAAEEDLVRNIDRVVGITHSLEAREQAALARCLRVMSDGMLEFQHRQQGEGLTELADLARYCYYVAGVVGEMLTELFCLYCDEIAAKRDALLPLAVSFGQGLQMTNILKDIWDDHGRAMCWLPRRVFACEDGEVSAPASGADATRFRLGVHTLAREAHGHLNDALRYVQMLPSREAGLRRFCLYALGMALLTLRNIARHPNFQRSDEVKIRRSTVYGTVAVARTIGRSNWLIGSAHALVSRSLPRDVRSTSDVVS